MSYLLKIIKNVWLKKIKYVDKSVGNEGIRRGDKRKKNEIILRNK